MRKRRDPQTMRDGKTIQTEAGRRMTPPREESMEALAALYDAIRPIDGSAPDLANIDAVAERVHPVLSIAMSASREEKVREALTVAIEALGGFRDELGGSTRDRVEVARHCIRDALSALATGKDERELIRN